MQLTQWGALLQAPLVWNSIPRNPLTPRESRKSGAEALRNPRLSLTVPMPPEAVVQAERPVRPELDLERDDPDSSPEGRPSRIEPVRRRHPRHFRHQGSTRGQWLRLMRRPRAQ